MDVREWHDEIVFLHKVKPGAADRSYGIQVAKLAGLPASRRSARAREVLALLEKSDGKEELRAMTRSTSCRCLLQCVAQDAGRCQAAPRPVETGRRRAEPRRHDPARRRSMPSIGSKRCGAKLGAGTRN